MPAAESGAIVFQDRAVSQGSWSWREGLGQRAIAKPVWPAVWTLASPPGLPSMLEAPAACLLSL